MATDARFEQERSTQHRASVLNMAYIDTSAIKQKVLYKNLLSVQELKDLRVIPLTADEHHISFGITTTTSQNTMKMLTQRFQDQKIRFSIISDVGFQDYILLYDPPKKIEYKDIAITKDTDAHSIDKISANASTNS